MHNVKTLTRQLSKVRPFELPKQELEQYMTDPAIAAQLLLYANELGDVEDKHVADLGCGTGMLGIAALELGAALVSFLDLDANALAVCEQNLLSYDSDRFELLNKALVALQADTVLMNPPFGTQNEHADRSFLVTAMESADVIYSIHLASSEQFIDSLAADHGFSRTHTWPFTMRLAKTLAHHDRNVQQVPVIAVRLAKL